MAPATFPMNSSLQTYISEIGLGIGTKDVEKAPNRNHGHGFNRWASNSMESYNIMNVNNYINNHVRPVMVVDIGAAYGRYSMNFMKIRTPKFNDFWSLFMKYGP